MGDKTNQVPTLGSAYGEKGPSFYETDTNLLECSRFGGGEERRICVEN